MITLLTAAPGGGKTAYAVGVMMLRAEAEGRPIFVHGIPDLTIEHSPTPPVDDWAVLQESPDQPGMMLPYFTFPPGSLIFIDEAQRIFRTRANGSTVPAHVAAFETHRHTGVDFVLMTQHPQLLDNNVRKLVGRHIHLRDVGMLGRWFYEWPECTDVAQFKTAPVKKRYKLPKRAFALYKSSSLHIKPVRSVPPVLILFGLAIVATLLLGWRFYSTLQSKVHPNKSISQSSSGAISSATGQGGIVLKTPQQTLTELVPIVPDRPETAPIYDGLRVAKVMPQIVGCIRHEGGCNCYTQQGTKAAITPQYCENWMHGNRSFNPYLDPPQQPLQNQQDQVQTPRQAAIVQTAPGTPPEWLQGSTSSPIDKSAKQPPQTVPQPMQGSPAGA